MERACDQHPRRVTAARIAKGLAAAMTARCGILLFLRIDSASGYLAVLLPALVIHGIGNGLSFPSLNIAAVSDLPEHQQGLASGLITSAVQIGAGYQFLAAGCFSVIGALVAALGIRATKPTRQPVPTHP
jgi:fucose permease